MTNIPISRSQTYHVHSQVHFLTSAASNCFQFSKSYQKHLIQPPRFRPTQSSTSTHLTIIGTGAPSARSKESRPTILIEGELGSSISELNVRIVVHGGPSAILAVKVEFLVTVVAKFPVGPAVGHSVINKVAAENPSVGEIS